MNKRSSKFTLFSFDVGALYKSELNNSQIEAAFEKLVKISDFDGIKKLTPNKKKGSSLTLTSADGRYVLVLRRRDLSVKYTNTTLVPPKNESLEEAIRLFTLANEMLDGYDIGALRSRSWSLSTSAKDKNYLIHELVNEQYADYLKRIQIALDIPTETSRKARTVEVSTQHTTDMHKAFEALNKVDKLDRIVAVFDAHGLKIMENAHEAEAFFTDCLEDAYRLTALERLGYVE